MNEGCLKQNKEKERNKINETDAANANLRFNSSA
jgi:hypothetical protein